jgi:thiol-disulfide isomerase/thioredoxin
MKTLVACAAALLCSLAASLALGAEVPYTQAQFDAARAAGQTVAVVFHADWCPTCRAQAPVLKELADSPEMKSLTLYVADFDKEKALRNALHVNQQSTIVVFKGKQETARSTGETQKGALETFLRGAIS